MGWGWTFSALMNRRRVSFNKISDFSLLTVARIYFFRYVSLCYFKLKLMNPLLHLKWFKNSFLNLRHTCNYFHVKGAWKSRRTPIVYRTQYFRVDYLEFLCLYFFISINFANFGRFLLIVLKSSVRISK